MFIKRDDFIKMIDLAVGIDEIVELRDMLESDNYEIECHLEMSSMVSLKESDCGI